jgi:hypothetical protein
MPRGREKQPGFKKLPNVPYRRDDIGPNQYDTDTSRGALCYVPREPVYRAMDFGSPTTGRGSLASPARANFTLGAPETAQSVRDSRLLPENQLDGSLNTQAGVGTPKMTQQKKMNLGGNAEGQK